MIYEKHLDTLADITQKFVAAEDIKIVVEIGASDGVETFALSQKYPKAMIYSFECNPDTIPVWLENCAKSDRIIPIQKAVSDKEGSLSFFPIDTKKTITSWADGNPGASSLFMASGKYPAEQYVQREVKVESTTLEKFMESNNLSDIDLIWMDVQGAELLVLHGAGKRLKDINIIHTEVEFFPIYEGQPLFDSIKKFMNKKEFFLGFFTNFGKYSGDAVFINPRMLNGKPGLKFYITLKDKLLYPIKASWRFFKGLVRKVIK